MIAKDITGECVDVFSWKRHGDMDTERAAEYVQRLRARRRFFKPASALNEDEQLNGKIVLDMGCGGGLKSNTIAFYGPKLVVGIDGSKPAITAATRLSESLQHRNTMFIHGYIEDAPTLLRHIGIAQVDFILSAQMIHHTTDWRANLKMFHDVLKDGGVLSVSWLDWSSNWGQYMWKNKIAYTLGRDHDARLRIGKVLFGRFDRRQSKIPVDWDSFYADRYAAFYKLITIRQMVRALRNIGFAVLESYPSIHWNEWRRQASSRSTSRRGRFLVDFLDHLPFLSGLASTGLRLHQFMGGGGDIRTLYCKKLTPHPTAT